MNHQNGGFSMAMLVSGSVIRLAISWGKNVALTLGVGGLATPLKFP